MKVGNRWLIVLAGLCCAAAAAWSYELETGAGTSIGSAGTEAFGSFYWDLLHVSGAYALGTTGSGIFSLSADGTPGLDAELRTDATYAVGRMVSGLRLEAWGTRSPEDEIEAMDIWATAPIVMNGSEYSVSVSPRFGLGFLDEEFTAYGMEAAVSFLAGDVIIKPGFMFTRTYYSDEASTLEIMPRVCVVWYPGLPATAEFSAGWSRTEFDDGAESVEFPIDAVVSVVPAPWLGITVQYRCAGDASDTLYQWISCEVEPVAYGRGGRTIRFPLEVFYGGYSGMEEIGLSIAAIISLR